VAASRPAPLDAPPVVGRRASVARFAAIFGSALVVGQIAQLVWLIAGSRAMPRHAFGAVLAAQALYGVLQFAVDNGAAFHGARLAAAGRLDDAERASLVRLRLQLALPAMVLACAAGAVGGRRFLEAVAPFAVALALFALLTYWERFGLGDSGPWSAYVVLRAAGPAALAVAFLAAGGTLPVFLPGAVECGVIVVVALAFGLRPLTNLVRASSARRGPWRNAIDIGLPNVIGQLALASGTVLLGMFGRPEAAALLAVSVRLLTGVNQLSGVLATALFPQLARGDGRGDERGVSATVALTVALVAAVNAVLVFRPSLVVGIFLKHPSTEAVRTALVTLGAAGASSYLVLVTLVLIARHHERVFLRIYGVGTGLTVAAGIAVAAAAPSSPALWMAGALVGGQLVSALLFARRGSLLLPGLRRVLATGAVAAVAFSAAGALAAASGDVRAPLAIAEAGAMLVALAAVRRTVARSA
jgi:O-antigen/teichoic acid export membrane protein